MRMKVELEDLTMVGRLVMAVVVFSLALQQHSRRGRRARTLYLPVVGQTAW